MKSLVKSTIFTLAMLASVAATQAMDSPKVGKEKTPLTDLIERDWFAMSLDQNALFQTGAFKVYDLDGNLLMSSDTKEENPEKTIRMMAKSDFLTDFAGTRIYILK
jgi:hypothetical protein